MSEPLPQPVRRAKFISVEGIDGSGKSTQLAHIEALLQTRNIPVVMTREPGGTALGERIRELVLNHPMHVDTEILLMFAARREHIAKVILPALETGKWVLCDRFVDASYAYQGGGRGIDFRRLEEIERWAVGALTPDLTLFFDAPLDVARQRLEGAHLDRFEQEQRAFFERVRRTYIARAEQYPQRIKSLDANRPEDRIAADVALHVENLLRD